MPIDTVEDLHEHLRLAIEVELTTIPPYLYAMYSISEPSSEAAKLILSVAAEEMLHASLMANVLLAVGGEPHFDQPEVVPSYPCNLPHHVPDLPLSLEPCSEDVVRRSFLTIEAPGNPGAPSQPDRWESQGQFYHALEEALRRLDAADPQLFAEPRAERQFHDPDGYLLVKFDDAASGGLQVVCDLEGAIAATEVAVHQGEGVHEERYADDSHAELTHHAKFMQLVDGTTPIGEVHPAVVDPSAETLPDDVAPVARLFNAVYTYSFLLLDQLLEPGAGHERERHARVGLLYGSMVALMGPLARYLMTCPIDRGVVAGPPFEYHHFEDPARAPDEMRAMAGQLRAGHPRLEPALDQLRRL